MSKDLHAKIKLLIKSEKALLNLEIHKRGRQSVLIAIALLAVLISLIMLNTTVYIYLETLYGSLKSTAILSGLNIILAIIFFVIASRQDRGIEADSIEEIRDFAWSQIATDIDEVKHSVDEFAGSLKKAKNSVNSLTNGSSFGISKIMPIISTLISLNKKR